MGRTCPTITSTVQVWGGWGRWRLRQVLWGILYWCLRVGPWRQHRPPASTFALTSVQGCRVIWSTWLPEAQTRLFPLQQPAVSISHPHKPLLLSKTLHLSPLCCTWSSAEWRNGSSSTAEEPRARVFPHKYLQLLLSGALSDRMPAISLALDCVSSPSSTCNVGTPSYSFNWKVCSTLQFLN